MYELPTLALPASDQTVCWRTPFSCQSVILKIAGQELHRYLGHTDRLGRIAIHPMGRHIGTASFDQTWRLWDLENGDCSPAQEGHSSSGYAVAFQGGGAPAASGGLDDVGALPRLYANCMRQF